MGLNRKIENPIAAGWVGDHPALIPVLENANTRLIGCQETKVYNRFQGFVRDIT